MYLIVGSEADGCCSQLHQRLTAQGASVHFLPQLFDPSVRVSLWIQTDGMDNRIVLPDGQELGNDTLDGVFVRNWGWIDPAGWAEQDRAYKQTEAQAAMLAWLWSLRCPVINRPPAHMWYRPAMSLANWLPWIWKAGMSSPSMMITNRAADLQYSPDSKAGAVFAPVSGTQEFLAGNDREWAGLLELSRLMPIGLNAPHAQGVRTCVVGSAVIWDREVPPEWRKLEKSLASLAAISGLDFLELAIASVEAEPAIVSVSPQVSYELFGAEAQAQILAALFICLHEERTSIRKGFSLGLGDDDVVGVIRAAMDPAQMASAVGEEA
jgi:hypothetical protein